jgi:hypothetical protein
MYEKTSIPFNGKMFLSLIEDVSLGGQILDKDYTYSSDRLLSFAKMLFLFLRFRLNAIEIQVWTAMLANLLLTLIKSKIKRKCRHFPVG